LDQQRVRERIPDEASGDPFTKIYPPRDPQKINGREAKIYDL
jgi:hypothetical protein